MREQLNTTLGFYRPSFFKMHVNTLDNLDDVNTLSDITSATYLHEYVHFLQDITTVFGFTNISTVVDYIKYVNEWARGSATRTFSVPVTPRPSLRNEVSFNLKLKALYVGDVNDVNIASVTAISKQKKTVTLKMGNVDIDSIIIDYNVANGPTQYHQFGSHCIIESMAFLIENAIYPGLISPTADFPYKSAQKVVEFEYPQFLQDPLNVLALCDVSLSTFNPGEFFFTMLSIMKQAGYIPKKPEDVYGYCSSLIQFNFNGASSLNQLLVLTGNSAISQLCDYFTTPLFGDNNNWIDYTITTAIGERLNNPYFILDIARGGKIQTNRAFINIFKKIGSPLVTNLNDEGSFYSPLQATHNIKIEYFWAISQIYSLYLKPLAQNAKKCELKLWCQASCHNQGIPDFTDPNCYNSPWLRVNFPQSCAFATIWKTWGMENEIPQ